MSVSAIVPAHNEAKTVGDVVRALKACRKIDDVIVVDDGSIDGTAEAARAAGARVIEIRGRVGKGDALAKGVSATDASVLLFVDADLIGFKPENADELLTPVLEGRYAMCAGLRDRGALLTALISPLPLIGGERALRREVFEGVPERFRRGFRIEIAMNGYCRANCLPYGGVPSRGVSQVRKIEKVGFWKGMVEYVAMIYQLSAAIVSVSLHQKEFLK